MKVYLSGGMTTGNNWQDKVMQQCPQFNFIDPRSHKLSDPKEYIDWDLSGIEQCDILFAYMSKDNPSGYGLSLEVGYAKAIYGKIIIMVDELNKDSMAIVRCCADELCDNLDYGIEQLNEIYEVIESLKE